MNYKGKNKKFIRSIIALFLLLVMFVSATYAYFNGGFAKNTEISARISSSTVDSLIFKIDKDISFSANKSNFNKGMGNQSGITNATAILKANNETNNATEHYYLYLDIINNEFNYSEDSSKPELILQVNGPDGEVTQISGLEYKTVVDGKKESISGFDITTKKGLINLIINREITTTSEKIENWEVKVIFVNLDIDQRINGGKEFNASVVISKTTKEELYMLQNVSAYYPKSGSSVTDNSDKLWKYKENITKVKFEEEKIDHSNAIETFDISAENSKPIMAHLVDNGDETYTAYIQADGKIKANTDSSYLFYKFKNLQTVEGIENVDMSYVTNMSNMFENCSSLTSLNVSNWDTSNVTRMDYMFSSCGELVTLDVSAWDTSQIKSMDTMFYYCKKLTTLDVGSWITSNFTTMHAIFMGCYELLELDVSKWNTSKVTDMSYLFIQCKKITTLDVSNWDTSKVTNMVSMFYDCNNLESIDPSRWDTSQVKYMENMFDGCNSISSLEIKNWDTSNVEHMNSMFQSCKSLTSLDLSNWNISKVFQMGIMFNNCTNLQTLNLSGWDTSNVTSFYNVFSNCPNLISIDLRNATFDYFLDSSVNPFYYKELFKANSSDIQIIVKDETVKAFIEARLAEANGGTVTIA